MSSASARSLSRLIASLRSHRKLALLNYTILVTTFSLVDRNGGNGLTADHFNNDPRGTTTHGHTMQRVRRHGHGTISLCVNRPAHGRSTQSLCLPSLRQNVTIYNKPNSNGAFDIVSPLVHSTLSRNLPITVCSFGCPARDTHRTTCTTGLNCSIHILTPNFPRSRIYGPVSFLHDRSSTRVTQRVTAILGGGFQLVARDDRSNFFTTTNSRLARTLLVLTGSARCPSVVATRTILKLAGLNGQMTTTRNLGD